MTHSGHGLIIEILAHVFCAISQLSDPNNPYYGASIEITHFLKFFKISNFSEISTCRIDSNQRQRNETPLDSSKIISKSRLRRRESGQGKIRTLRTTEIPFYPLYPLTTVPLQSKIMYFHQLLWFLCYHFLTDFKITFTVTFFRSLLSTVDNVNFTRGNTVISPTGITVWTVILGEFEPFQTLRFYFFCWFQIYFQR